MKLAKTLLTAAAVIALTAPTYAQVTPGGPGERKANESPPTMATQAPAGTQPQMQKAPNAGSKSQSGTTGAAASDPQTPAPEPGGAGGPQKADDSDRKANEAPGLKR